jgi:hypothetical protein
MQAVLKAQINKTDRNDARGIAQMMRVGLYRPVHVKTLRSQKLRMLLTHRKLLQSSGKKLFVVGHPHAQLMAEGICRRAARMRSADRNRVRRSFGECRRKGSAQAPRADNDNLFHASPPWSKTDGL